MPKDRAPGQLSWAEKTSKSPVEIWGLTGGIASGKSSAARFFEEAGFPVLDADQLSRDLSGPKGPAHGALQRRFGTADRAKLKEIVFRDAEARKDLEAILHPLIQAESMKRVHAIAEGWKGPKEELRVIYEAALLVETGRYKTLSGLIVIEAPREVRLTRMIERDQVDRATAEKILEAQASDEERRRAATAVLLNDGDLPTLKARVQDFISRQGWKSKRD